MNIVCVAWGSLLWNLKGFPVAGDWYPDGPALPLEFARHSDGEIASLVILEDGPASTTFWAPLECTSLDHAREALRGREDIRAHADSWIGSVPNTTGAHYLHEDVMARWLKQNGADAVVWTALPPKSKDQNGRMPTVDEAIAYLCGLPEDERRRAEQYIRRTPRQIQTPFRSAFEKAFSWMPVIAATEA